MLDQHIIMTDKKVEECMNAIMTNVGKLVTLKVPVVVVIHHQGKVVVHGTKLTRQHLQSDKLTKKELEKDGLSLCSRNPDTDEPLLYFKGGAPNDIFPKLPAPLELLKAKEAIKVLRHLVIQDHNKHHEDEEGTPKDNLYIKYGSETWEPTFWPSNLWKWENMKNFSNITVADMKKAGLGETYENLTDFFRDVIRMAFQKYEIDPTEHITESYTEKEENLRKKSRHIKSAPKIVNPAPPTPPRPLSDVFVEAEEDVFEQEYQYRPAAAFTHLPEEEEVPNANDNVGEIPGRINNQGYEPETEPILTALFRDSPNEGEVSVPRCALRKVRPNWVIKRSKTGATSIARAAALALGLCEEHFWRIKIEIHEKIISAFSFFEESYEFPIELHTETGTVCFNNSNELLQFLRSPASMQLYNFPLVELLALANIIGASVHVLHLRVAESVMDLDNRWEWSSHPPIAPHTIDTNGRYYTNKDLYFITEDNVNHYLLSESSKSLKPNAENAANDDAGDTADEEEATDAVVAAAEDEAIMDEAEEELNLERFCMVPIGSLAKVGEVREESIIEEMLPTIPETLSRSSSSATSIASAGSSSSNLRRSTRVPKLTERYELYKLIQPPTKSTQRREKENAKKRKRDQEDHQKYIDDLHQQADRSDRQREAARIEVDRVRELAEQLRAGLTEDNIVHIFYDNLEYFKNLANGNEVSWRYEAFKRGGKTDDALMFRMIGAPFTDQQQDVVFKEVEKIWLNERLMSRFVDVVISPEVFIRIYQIFFGLTKAEAEKNLDNAQANAIPTYSGDSNNLLIS